MDDPTAAAETDAAIAEATRLIDEAERISVLTGAGISTDSGIPDFRGPQGVWTKNPAAEKASNIQYYVSDPEVRKANWERRAAGELWADVEPNAGHRALVQLERREKLHTLITQNVDELHQRAGSSPGRVVEIHGTTRKAMCLECDWRDEIDVVLDRVRGGEPGLDERARRRQEDEGERDVGEQGDEDARAPLRMVSMIFSSLLSIISSRQPWCSSMFLKIMKATRVIFSRLTFCSTSQMCLTTWFFGTPMNP